MIRLLFVLLCLLCAPAAKADDISAASRGVVRVVVVALEDGEIVDFGHGSGFAVAPNRIVTNAHVVALAAQYPQATAIGVVPSEGSQSFGARIIAIDTRRDLALLELERGRVQPVSIFTGRVPEGAPVAALGYPGNVDLATAQSINDYVSPLPPTRSAGNFSNIRTINGVNTLLHTASIARGNSGGPLMDQCGRVLGVNTLITRNEEGDAPFFFAVGNAELIAFLRAARQPFPSTSAECISMAERLREDRDRSAAESRARELQAAAQARAQDQQLSQARAAIAQSRENHIALSVLLIVLSLVAFGGAGVLLVKNMNKPAPFLAGLGVVLLLGSIAAFLSRPGYDEAEAALAEDQGDTPGGTALAARNICALVPERSRVTVTATTDVPLGWSGSGCVNGRTQYAQNGEVWTRILVPQDEPAVSVLEVRPARGEYVVSRYLLDTPALSRARELRRGVNLKTCSSQTEELTLLAEQQRQIGDMLPQLPNERLVYRCTPS